MLLITIHNVSRHRISRYWRAVSVKVVSGIGIDGRNRRTSRRTRSRMFQLLLGYIHRSTNRLRALKGFTRLLLMNESLWFGYWTKTYRWVKLLVARLMLSLLTSGTVAVAVTATAAAAAVGEIRAGNDSDFGWRRYRRMQRCAARWRWDIRLGRIASVFGWRWLLLLLWRAVTVGVAVVVSTLEQGTHVIWRMRPWQVNTNPAALMIQVSVLLIHAIVGRDGDGDSGRVVGMRVCRDGVVVERSGLNSRRHTWNSCIVLKVEVVFFLIGRSRNFVAQDVGAVNVGITLATSFWNRKSFTFETRNLRLQCCSLKIKK